MKRYYFDFIKKSTSQEYLVTTRGYDDKDKALAKYHEEMKEAMSNENVYYAQAIVHDDEGGFLVVDVYGSLEQEEVEENVD